MGMNLKTALIALAVVLFIQSVLLASTSLAEQCKENWVCSTWGPCTMDGIQTRFCKDLASCGTQNMTPALSRLCVLPSPSCYDGILNQGEAGVDCGGPCMPCSEQNHVLKPMPAPDLVQATLTMMLLITLVGVIGLSTSKLCRKTKALLTATHIGLLVGISFMFIQALTTTSISTEIAAGTSFVVFTATFILSFKFARHHTDKYARKKKGRGKNA